ncbi:MAG: outer membrane beta-barrel protein, partial [Pedobacter sp.]|nr:outer membrane beta-barrel protein [Pedobacter sp.]
IGTGQLQIIIKEMAIAPKQTPIEEVADPKPIKKTSKRFPISLALAAGPDFNSTTSAIGGKTNVAIGLGIGVGITRKLSLQTGINYGHKNYDADAYNYTFNNPNTKNTIAEVNASCKVIEIPLRASLNVSDNKKRSIDVNAGLSSYLMLKEDYVYKYTPESGRSDRLVEAVNENQHILSVVDLSATYNIKLNQKLAFGIEPYVKIPISGIGVGSVPLK